MALEWDITDIKDYDAKFPTDKIGDDEQWNVVTQGIVWLCLFCGISAITEKTLDKVASRILLFDKLFGPNMSRPFTYEDIKGHVGLKVWGRQTRIRTNASFYSMVGKRLFEETLRKIKEAN